jgi:hypothetical protein
MSLVLFSLVSIIIINLVDLQEFRILLTKNDFVVLFLFTFMLMTLKTVLTHETIFGIAEEFD